MFNSNMLSKYLLLSKLNSFKISKGYCTSLIQDENLPVMDNIQIDNYSMSNES